VFDRIQLLTDDKEIPEKELVIVANIKKEYSKYGPDNIAEAPKAELDKLEHDFGTVKEGVVVTFGFQIKNTGKDPLVIYDIKSSCGCTATTLGTDRVKAGDASVLKVSFDSKDKVGYNEKTVTLITNDPAKEEIYITIKALVVATSGGTQQNNPKK
jgi:hypothetical protein